MKCKICGGQLEYREGLFVCSSCGTKQELSAYFEDTEVFIACTENDETGRRSRDSVVAQDIYNRLENVKVRCYYQRISAGELTEEEYQKCQAESLGKARVLLMVATTEERFQKMLDKYGDLLSEKTIIPVYSGMEAYQLPPDLLRLQALNYDNLGAIADFPNAVLALLGREGEVSVSAIAEEGRKKRKKGMVLSVVFVLVALLAIGLYFTFFTPYVLKSKKYEHAIELSNSGQYVEAIHLLTELGEYENSKNELDKIYSQYEGYFSDEDQTTQLHLNIDSNRAALIEVSVKSEDAFVKMGTNAIIEEDRLAFDYKDGSGNIGKGTLLLTNEGIDLELTTATDQQPSLGDIKEHFSFDCRSDAPVKEELGRETLIGWLSKKTTESDIKSMGYDLKFQRPLYRDNAQGVYQIEKTDIRVAFYDYDIKNTDYDYTNPPYSDDRVLFALAAPAEILLPESVGKKPDVVIQDGFIYIPDGDFVLEVGIGCNLESELKEVQKDTLVYVTSKSLIGSENWDNLLEYYAYKDKILKSMQDYKTNNSSSMTNDTSEEEYENEIGNPDNWGAGWYEYDVKVTASDGGVNFRQAPGAEYKKLISGMIPNGTILHIEADTQLADGAFWGWTQYNGQYGWVYLDATTTINGDV